MDRIRVIHKNRMTFLKKKEAKKEKRVRMWRTLRVPHILTRQTSNK
ncbi:MAG: hypothetical protein JWQ54_544 [Mucilaginibacter sp.]|nr:hypothetical protein [Mucilaginibacter sp.]